MQIVAGNGEDVGLAFAQRRDFQIDHGDAIVEIRAEEPLPDRMGDVPVGGRDKAEVHADGLRSAHAMEAALLKDPQELGLHPRAGLREFIQKQRAVFGHFHQTGLAGHGSRERSLFMPEELALEQLVLKARHVDDDKPAAPAAFLVDVPGHHLLAHAGFPAKQDGSVGFRRKFHIAEQPSHLIGNANHLSRRIRKRLKALRMTPLPLHDAGTLPGKDTPDIFQHILFKDGADLRQKSPDMAQRINPIGTAVYGDADQHASEPHPPFLHIVQNKRSSLGYELHEIGQGGIRIRHGFELASENGHKAERRMWIRDMKEVSLRSAEDAGRLRQQSLRKGLELFPCPVGGKTFTVGFEKGPRGKIGVPMLAHVGGDQSKQFLRPEKILETIVHGPCVAHEQHGLFLVVAP